MRRISKRLETLERAADREIFEKNSLAINTAIAYYLGGAKHESELMHAYTRALGYQGLDELLKASAFLFGLPSESVDGPSSFWARIRRAQCKLLAKFGYDLRRLSSAALADAFDRIIRTLPEEWLARIKSAHREWCETEASINQFLEELMERAEECGVLPVSDGHQGDPR
jgi:ADP-ribose pyrophosphatase YjhB (NUDIX family)